MFCVETLAKSDEYSDCGIGELSFGFDSKISF